MIYDVVEDEAFQIRRRSMGLMRPMKAVGVHEKRHRRDCFEHVGNSWFDRAERALQKLHETHQVVRVHGNNNDTFEIVAGLTIPKLNELTWARRSSYKFVSTDETFPTEMDLPCTPAKPDLVRGTFAF